MVDFPAMFFEKFHGRMPLRNGLIVNQIGAGASSLFYPFRPCGQKTADRARRCASISGMTSKKPEKPAEKPQTPPPGKPVEIGGREGLDPVRYGDWEKDGRCVDF